MFGLFFCSSVKMVQGERAIELAYFMIEIFLGLGIELGDIMYDLNF